MERRHVFPHLTVEENLMRLSPLPAATFLDTGRVVPEGLAAGLAARDDLHRIYLGDGR